MLGLCFGCYTARKFAARKVARVCPYAAGQRGCIKHALYGEVARKHAPPCDTLSRLHVSYVGCSNPCAFVAAGNLSGRLGSMKAGPRHVTLPDHGVRLDGQSCSSLIVGWPVVLSSPTLGVGRPSVMFLFDCWPVVLPMLRTVRGCYTYHLCSMIRKRHWLVVHPAWPYLRYLANLEKKREKGIESVRSVVRKKDRIDHGDDDVDEQENHGGRPGVTLGTDSLFSHVILEHIGISIAYSKSTMSQLWQVFPKDHVSM
ncbi:hypothetical protein F2Q68_00020783 [Brassica cretica]|uniref:Uncharacterized protein n=1 Tax=Brassica cretica TaxID=69181 RepID=A0A8S9FZR9_BRACR|nr:hypothetical protein F2Q68_00020783 [Brassica cretica]